MAELRKQVSKGSVAAAASENLTVHTVTAKCYIAMIKEIHDVALQFDSGSIGLLRKSSGRACQSFRKCGQVNHNCSMEPGACIAPSARQDRARDSCSLHDNGRKSGAAGFLEHQWRKG